MAGQQLVYQVDTTLSHLTTSQLLQFNKQLLPSNIFSAELQLSTTLNVLSGGQANITNRLAFARLDTPTSGLAAGDSVGRGITVWGQPYGAVTSQGSSDGIDGYTAGTYGVTLGGDMMVAPNVRAGVALTLGNSDINYNGYLSGSNGSVFTSEFDLYGTWYRNNFFVDGLLSFAYNHYTRHQPISALGISLNSNSGGTQFSAKIGAGYNAKLGEHAVLTPYGSVQQFHFNFDGYTPSGGAKYGLDVPVNGQSANITQTRLGGRLAYPVTLKDGNLTPEVHAYWLHNFGSNRLTMTYTSPVGPTTFTSLGPPADRDIFDIGIAATFAKGPRWSFGGGYDYAGSSNASAHNFYVNVKYHF